MFCFICIDAFLLGLGYTNVWQGQENREDSTSNCEKTQKSKKRYHPLLYRYILGCMSLSLHAYAHDPNPNTNLNHNPSPNLNAHSLFLGSFCDLYPNPNLDL